MATHKIIVVGGGPCGMMAAIRAAECGASVALFEKNASLGRKLGLTGKGRCNLTNDAPLDEFLAKFGRQGPFLRNAFSKFSPEHLIHFFGSNGLKVVVERQGRVFPATQSSKSVIDVFKKVMFQRAVEVHLSAPVQSILVVAGAVRGVRLENCEDVSAQRVILATGGVSYPETGSTGDGFRIAEELGHSVTPLLPGLVPLEAKEDFVKDLQGLTLKNVSLVFESGKKKIETGIGELLFTHFGVSGPLVLDISSRVAALLEEAPVVMYIDLKCGLAYDLLEEKLKREFQTRGSSSVRGYSREILPQRMVDVVLQRAAIDGDKKCHQVTAPERRHFAELLKRFPVTIKRPRRLSEAMVTCGGVSLKDVDPKTMQSKKVRGLYFCGEVLDVAAESGGYNLQAAFSTGYLAGESAGESCSS